MKLKSTHVPEQCVDLSIVPISSSFGHKTRHDQEGVVSEIQFRSRQAGLAGTVVPVWDNGNGRMAFIAPPAWHPFFRSLSLGGVWANVNRELSW